jgi:hypothetical protein
LSEDDRWLWHAYDYGWRRVVLDDVAKTSPIDRDGVWFDAALAYSAETFYRRKFNKPAPGEGPAINTRTVARNVARFIERGREAFRPYWSDRD